MPAPSSNQFTLASLFAFVRQWADHNFPDHGDLALLIPTRSGKTRINIPQGEPTGNVSVRQSATSFKHSEDFREVNWCGHRFKFSKTQAAVVALLHEAKQTDAPDVPQLTLLQAVDSQTMRLTDLFRRGDAAKAWGVLIVQGDEPGSYRLADRPPEPSEA